jgi:hypothetical protein
MRRAVVITLLVLSLSAPADALASGGWVLPVLGGAGVSAVGSPFNWIAVSTGSGTLVERVRRGAGSVEASRVLRGSYGVPGAAQDGATTGLSADGRTLVLAGLTNAYPPARTQLLVLNAQSLAVDGRIALPGFFTVDAISPAGTWLYLTHYLPGPNGIQYQVRAYDLVHRQLLAKPIVDPRHPDEKMQGIPLARIMSADGRWAYTLYQGFSGAPFIHALDTAGLRAFCIDLPTLARVDLSSARLVLSSATTLRVVESGSPLALLNTRTLALQSLHAARAAEGSRTGERRT